jgi:hypothetical protein
MKYAIFVAATNLALLGFGIGLLSTVWGWQSALGIGCLVVFHKGIV